MVSWFMGRFHVLDWTPFLPSNKKNALFLDEHWYRANRDSLSGVILGSNQDFVELKKPSVFNDVPNHEKWSPN